MSDEFQTLVTTLTEKGLSTEVLAVTFTLLLAALRHKIKEIFGMKSKEEELIHQVLKSNDRLMDILEKSAVGANKEAEEIKQKLEEQGDE